MSKIERFLVLLFIFDIAFGDATTNCNDVEKKSTVLQLKRHLLCEYDPDVRSVKSNNNVTRVTFRLTPHFIEYSNEDEIFELHAWIGMSWYDSHLTWNIEQYDNIKWLPVEWYEIWVPDVMLHNEWSKKGSEDSQANVWVWHNGMIQWLNPVKFSTFCVPDNTWYPYSLMNCTIQLGSWSHSSDEIELIPYENKSLDISIEKPKHPEWDLLKVYVSTWEDRYKYNSGSTAKMISYHFIVRRHAGVIHVTYMLPIIVLMVMTLTVLWLEPKSYERMIIVNLNFICHLLCIKDIYWELPKSGFNTPKLILFYESSFAIATFTLVLTSILRHLQELDSEPPLWISSITTSILRSRAGQILLVSILDPAATAKIEVDADDNTDLMQLNSKRTSWRYVTVLVGWLAFFSVFLAYIVLLGTCFPTYNSVSIS